MAPFSQPDWDILLAGVAATPDDDLPRLVAADWLDEHDESERAEFIRLQCELARGAVVDSSRLGAMRWREHALLVSPTGGPLWAWEACPHIVKFELAKSSSPLRGIGLSGSERVRFRRGFPEQLTCPATDWHLHGEGVVPRQPIHTLNLTRCDELPLEKWWHVLATLKLMRKVTIDGHRAFLAEWLRDRLLGVEIC